MQRPEESSDSEGPATETPGSARPQSPTGSGATEAGSTGPDSPETDPIESGVTEPETEPEWWDDPRMPWAHKPERADLWCFSLIGFLGIYALALLPLRAVLLAHPHLAASLTGSRTGVVMIGALSAVGQSPWWPVWLVVAILSVMKFDPVYFWAGKLWGQGVFEMVAGRSPRARRNAERAERLARKYAVPALALCYLPIPIPAAVIYATLGAAGMRWRTFLGWNLVFATVLQTTYFLLGRQIGAPAVALMAAYGKYAWYVSLAILAGMLLTWWWNRRKQQRLEAARGEIVEEDPTER